jgi:N-acetylglucosaminyl-diphospho-decaprenol L-rhamnosyltransferase
MSVSDHVPDLDQVTVIVVTFNSAHCIEALATALKGFAHVIFVDNASHDHTQQEVRQRMPGAQWIGNDQNLGFGAANNLALRQVKTPFAFLLNPDCEARANDVMLLLAAAQAHPGFAIIVPQLTQATGKLDINYRWPSTEWSSQGPQADGPCCVGFVCGAAMLFNMGTMRGVGFFDESFFLYYEDDDLCKRVFDQKKQMLVIPSVRLIHRSRGSVGGSRRWRSEYWRGYHHVQSKIRFSKKYEGVEQARILRRRVLALALLALPFRLLVPVPRHVGRLAGRIGGLLSSRFLRQVLSA